MKIRLYQSKDALQLENLLLEFLKYKDKEYSKDIQKFMRNIKNKQRNYAKSYLKKFTQTKRSRFLVVEKDNKLIAYMLGSIQSNQFEQDKFRGYIDSFFVTKSHRKKGLGKLLYSRLISWFKKQNCKQVILDVAKGNPSIDIYEKWGFEQTKQEMRKKI